MDPEVEDDVDVEEDGDKLSTCLLLLDGDGLFVGDNNTTSWILGGCWLLRVKREEAGLLLQENKKEKKCN